MRGIVRDWEQHGCALRVCDLGLALWEKSNVSYSSTNLEPPASLSYRPGRQSTAWHSVLVSSLNGKRCLNLLTVTRDSFPNAFGPISRKSKARHYSMIWHPGSTKRPLSSGSPRWSAIQTLGSGLRDASSAATLIRGTPERAKSRRLSRGISLLTGSTEWRNLQPTLITAGYSCATSLPVEILPSLGPLSRPFETPLSVELAPTQFMPRFSEVTLGDGQRFRLQMCTRSTLDMRSE